MNSEDQNKNTLNIITGVPLVDLIVNIDWFTAHFEDRSKVLRIIKDLFNRCEHMKKLLQKHNTLIMKTLMNKYDKQCHLFVNPASKDAKIRSDEFHDKLSTHHGSHADLGKPCDPNGRDEFLAVIIGQLIRLYAKSKSLSKSFTDFELLERMASLCRHEQFII